MAIALWLCWVCPGVALASERTFLNLKVDFLNEVRLPAQVFQETPVGGLSALTYDRDRGLFYALSDDRSEKAPARFYTLMLDFDQQQPRLNGVAVREVTLIRDAQGQLFPAGSVDPEGMALSPTGTLWIATEGITPQKIPPFIAEYNRDGTWRRSLPIPDRFRPDPENQRGIQDNLGFESLTLVPNAPTDPYRLFTVTESALAQDVRPPTQGARSRFLHFYTDGAFLPPMVVAEHFYPVEVAPAGGIIGVTELMTLDRAGHFLSLERSFGSKGFGVKLWQIATGAAADTAAVPSLSQIGGNLRAIAKKLALDLGTLGITLDNLEGMTLGPKLADGSQSLILISDDNFNPKQVTQILLFRLRVERGST
ncbi:MAG: esterase-like activity of phytase family protein [Oscillatoriales cyanobacterium SM2_2_1]|nr:esterase-like activity of phytase family protein [Oscillatoriales cyanobacterium SM2_2_1]